MLLSNSTLSYEQLRKYVLDYIKSNEGFNQLENIIQGVASKLISLNFVSETSSFNLSHSQSFRQLSNRDSEMVNQVVWDLIIERVLTIGSDSNNVNWPFIRLTNYGKKVIQNSDSIILHDVSGVLEYLLIKIPSCDEIILQYFTECLNCNRINQVLAATVMLGCSAERAICLLYDSYKNWINNKYNGEYKSFEKLEYAGIARKFDHIKSSIMGHRSEIGEVLLEDFDLLVASIFNIIRKNRNDSGHPSGKSVEREELSAMTYAFITHCKHIYRLINFFNKL